jgi:hypothetical protein
LNGATCNVIPFVYRRENAKPALRAAIYCFNRAVRAL